MSGASRDSTGSTTTANTATQRRMPMQRGPMGQVSGGEKAQNFGPSAKRLLGTLRTDMPQLIVVLVLGILSVALSVIGPKLLGEGTNVVFAGFISLQVPEGVTKQQVVDQLVAAGNQDQANMIAAMDFVPGAGVDFDKLAWILSAVLAVYL